MSANNHESPTFGSDTGAAFRGIIIGAILLFAVLRAIVWMTNAHYNHEKPAATATK